MGLTIKDTAQATAANLTDRLPVSQGDDLAKTLTVQKIVGDAFTSSKSGSYTIAASDAGKVIAFTGVATVTLPAASGFAEGFQCILWNMTATEVDVTLSGSVVASGTKITQKKSAMLLVKGASWYAAGGLS